MYLSYQFRSKTVHSSPTDIDAQSLIVWSDDRKYSTVLVPKCVSSITYEEIKTTIPCFAGFSLSFFVLDKEECKNIESYLRTVKAINTASNITTYSLVVFTSAYEQEGLWELQRQLCSAHVLVQTAYYRSEDPHSGTLLKQVVIPFLIAISNKTCITKEQENFFTATNMYEQLISILSTENDLGLTCGKDKSKFYLHALNVYQL